MVGFDDPKEDATGTLEDLGTSVFDKRAYLGSPSL
jgi:hypothetical protein